MGSPSCLEELSAAGLEIIVGTYEEFLLGYKLSQSKDKKKQAGLELSFTNHSHCGSIRSMAIVGKYLASGSTDEVIRLINMDLRVEHGYMQQQNGTINCLTNFGNQYLFSGGSDGTICIWKSGSWVCEKTLQAHKGGVNDISVHPSGKLALSVGMDRSLKTWNLIKGRTGFVTNLHGVADVVKWSSEGKYFAVGILTRVDIYDVSTAKVVYSIPFGKRPTSIVFLKDDVVAVAGDKEIVEVHSISKSSKLSEFKAHSVRVKDMAFVNEHNVLVTISNCDQFVKLWKFEEASYTSSPTLITEHNTTCRAIKVIPWCKTVKGKEQSGEEETTTEVQSAEDCEDETMDDEDESENSDIDDEVDDDDDEDEEDEDEDESESSTDDIPLPTKKPKFNKEKDESVKPKKLDKLPSKMKSKNKE